MADIIVVEEGAIMIHRKLKVASKTLSGIVMLVGVLVILGWQINNEFLKRINPNLVAMNPLTAASFILCGFANFILCDKEGQDKKKTLLVYLCAGLVLAACGTLFASILADMRLPIDQLLYSQKLKDAEGNLPNKMAPNTAFNFILTSISLLLIEKNEHRYKKTAQVFITIVALVGLLSLYGYIYGVKVLYGVGAFIPMALHSAFCFVLLSLSVLFARPHQGLMGMLTSKGSGEILLLQFVAFFVPLFFGWLELVGLRAGYYGTEFGTALFVILTYLISIFFLSRTSVVQLKLEREKHKRDAVIFENEARLKAILDNIGEAVVVADKDGKFTTFNPAAEAIVGIGATEGPLTTWSEEYGLFEPDEVTPFPTSDIPLPKALMGESSDEVEMFVRNPKIPEGRKISVTGRPIKDSSGNITGGVVVFRNITEQKRIEKLIHENEKRLNEIISGMGEGIVAADLTGRFLLFNKKAEEILGIGPTMGSFKDWQRKYGIYLPDGKTPYPIEETPLVKALNGEATENVEIFIRNHHFPDGKTILVTGHPIKDDKGKVTSGVIDFHDITEKKKLEQSLKEIQEKYYSILKRKIPGSDKNNT